MFTLESIKQFLMPDWRKILLAIILLLGSLYIPVYEPRVDFNLPSGVNFDSQAFYSSAGFPLKYFFIVNYTTEINYSNLFIDIIFWYFISCFLISAWDKIRKK
ncbi:hypothetical protein KJ854_01485 [Patescibacteria group bacterium]|nr:hypothetical protein [Patescibacteria group bacterium]